MFQTRYNVYKQHDDTKNSETTDHSIGTLTLDFKTEANSEISVPHINPPINFIILRKSPYITPHTVMTPFIPNNNWDKFFYIAIDVTEKGASLSVKVEFIQPASGPMQLLAVARRGKLPNSTIENEIDFSTMLPHKMAFVGMDSTLSF